MLDALAGHRDGLTRQEIADRLGLSQEMVSRIVKRLLDTGLVIETPSPSPTPGRDPGTIRVNERARGVIAIDLGGTKCHGALADFAGQTIAEDFRLIGDGTPVGTLLGCVDAMRAAAAREALPVSAVAIGIPAVVDPDTGLIVDGPNVGWSGFDLRGVLVDHVSEPLVIDNDVNLAALGHASCGDGQGVDDFVTVAIGTGIGAAIVSGGELVRGGRNSAGELGNLITQERQLDVPAGELAGLETTASGTAVARRACELIAEEGVGSSLPPTGLSAEDVFVAATAEDPVARRVIHELLNDLAIAMVALIAIVDPELVIFDGSVGRALEPYLDEMRDRVSRRIANPPRFCVSQLGPNATVAGAITSALALARREGVAEGLPSGALGPAAMSRRRHRTRTDGAQSRSLP